jgi:hypothetical protein
VPTFMDTFVLKPSHLIETVKSQPANANQMVLLEHIYNLCAHNSCNERYILPSTTLDAAMTSKHQPLLQQIVMQYNIGIMMDEVIGAGARG